LIKYCRNIRDYSALFGLLVLAGCGSAPAVSQQQRAAELRAFSYQMKSAANKFSSSVPYYGGYQTPQVAPLYTSGSNSMRCISTGFYTNCRY
jgi:hypothetical protein